MRVAAISACSPIDVKLYAVAPFLTPSRRVCGHHGVLEAAVPAAALAFAAAAAAPGSAAAAPTGLSHGVSTGPVAQGVCFVGTGRGCSRGASITHTRLYERLDASVLFARPRDAGAGRRRGWVGEALPSVLLLCFPFRLVASSTAASSPGSR